MWEILDIYSLDAKVVLYIALTRGILEVNLEIKVYSFRSMERVSSCWHFISDLYNTHLFLISDFCIIYT